MSPDDVLALSVAARIMFKARKLTQAYQFASRAVDADLNSPYTWGNLGMMQEQLYRFAEADTCFRKAADLAKDDKSKGFVYLNWGCMLVNKADWEHAEPMARRAVKYNPTSAKAKANLGIAQLAAGNWAEGWQNYDAVIGFDQSRRKVQYKGEAVWDGSADKRIVIYGEQGLGDEISFASMVPDAIKRAGRVVIDCTDKLEGLFQRSFPDAVVYGTRWEKNLGWDKAHAEIDASISIGGLGQHFRLTDESFPGTPYLIPDPERTEMWRALFAKQGKPVIGIAWSGGVPWTADRYRRVSLHDLLPVFQSVDAVWVSLEYKDAAREIAAFRKDHPEIDIRQYAFGTLTQDYDDTAALVAALDKVVSIQTAVIHLAGALGKECHCLVNRCGQWRYGKHGSKSLPWYKSVKLYWERQDGGWPVDEVASCLTSS